MNTALPLLSIITVCLNEPQLERTCESIVNQTFQDFEWIVIDGGSNDETLAIFERYKSRMDYFVSEPDGGIYFGMNKGIGQAAGEWLNFMNAGDCFARANVLENVSSFIATNAKNAGIVYGHYVVCDGRNSRVIVSREYVDKKCIFKKFLNHQSSFIRRSLFDLVGNYNTEYAVLADIDFYLKIFVEEQYKLYRIDMPIAVYSQEGLSSTNKTLVFEELSKLQSAYLSSEEILELKKEQALQVRSLMQSKV